MCLYRVKLRYLIRGGGCWRQTAPRGLSEAILILRGTIGAADDSYLAMMGVDDIGHGISG